MVGFFFVVVFIICFFFVFYETAELLGMAVVWFELFEFL
jgi:hypothetical protein